MLRMHEDETVFLDKKNPCAPVSELSSIISTMVLTNDTIILYIQEVLSIII